METVIQPSSSSSRPEMQSMDSLLSQSPLQDQSHLDITHMSSHFDPTAASHDVFLEQMLSSMGTSSCSWPDALNLNPRFPWDHSSMRSRDMEEDEEENERAAAAANPESRQHNQQFQMGDQPVAGSFGGEEDTLIPLHLNLSKIEEVVGDGSVHALYEDFAGSLLGSYPIPNQFLQQPQVENFAPAAPMMKTTPSTSSAGGQPRQRVRARRGQATDPHSIAERLRRERIAERMKALQELVPNSNKTDKASMLDEIIEYLKFLQLQVKVLSVSRLGNAAAASSRNPLLPLVAGGVEAINNEEARKKKLLAMAAAAATSGESMSMNMSSPGNSSSSSHVMENHVVKLMEEDMGSAMQYLQGKGLCLMPISLATAISTSTSTTTPRQPPKSTKPAADPSSSS